MKIMERENAPKLLTIQCSYCNRKIHATMKQFVDGMECAGCGMPVTIGTDESMNSFSSFMHKAQCLNCGNEFDIPLSKSFKYLAECPKCNTLFVRKNMVFDEHSPDDKESEAFKLMETLYPAIPNNLNNEIVDSAMAGEPELQFLRDLNIKADKPTSRVVQRLARQIFDMIDVVVRTNYNSIEFFEFPVRSKLYMHIAASPLFRKIYFDIIVTKKEMEATVREGIGGNNEMYQALSASIDTAAYEIAAAYIVNFAKIIFDQELDVPTARKLALQAFGRGFGNAIRRAGYFIYLPDERRVKSIAKLSLPAMKSFYTQRNRINNALTELLQDNNYKKPAAKGCLGLIVTGGIIAAIAGKYLIG